MEWTFDLTEKFNQVNDQTMRLAVAAVVEAIDGKLAECFLPGSAERRYLRLQKRH